jgi:hypothetical protein
MIVDGLPHIVFLAKQNIPIGAELLYDYGEKRSSVLIANPWLAH